MTEPGTAVAAGRLLPAACPPGPEAVSRPSLLGLGLGEAGEGVSRPEGLHGRQGGPGEALLVFAQSLGPGRAASKTTMFKCVV